MSKLIVPIHHPRHEPAGADEINDIDIGNTGVLLSAHKARHVTAGADTFVAGDLLEATARVVVRKNTGANVGIRRRLNLIEGANVTLTVADDGGNEEVDVTIASAGGGTGSDTSQFFPATDPNAYKGTYPAVELADGADITVYQSFIIPKDLTSLSQASILIITAGTGNIRWSSATNFARICAAEDYNAHTDSTATADSACTVNKVTCLDITGALTGMAAKDIVGISFTRYGSHANDTIGASVFFLGIYVEGT